MLQATKAQKDRETPAISEDTVHAKRLALTPVEYITPAMPVFRGHKVLLDVELAELYGVPTKVLNQVVKRNAERFPEDYMFRLSRTEAEALNRSRSVTASHTHHDPRFPPYAFTGHGAIMAASVLNSPKAVEMSVYFVRAFVHMRELLSSNRELARHFAQLETRLGKKLTEHDLAIAAILSAICERMHRPLPKRRPNGFSAALGRKL